ncbi:MAG TPA: HPr kinase/phosphatase C-terminal domain-containing protein [Rhizomicrobium sp.]|nr:HPr kinase/phosphatase C-terminal domain-containing protein [Rhizomicrobium sp.]
MPSANIHATCILLARAGEAFGAPADAGILLLGESGVGKSDLAMRLIALGATLVADDRVELSVENNLLIARAPANLAGLIEIRNVGIVALPHAAEARVALAALLGTGENLPRLPEHERYRPPAGINLVEEFCPPLLRLSAFEISAPAKIAAAAAAFAHGLFREDSKRN